MLILFLLGKDKDLLLKEALKMESKMEVGLYFKIVTLEKVLCLLLKNLLKALMTLKKKKNLTKISDLYSPLCLAIISLFLYFKMELNLLMNRKKKFRKKKKNHKKKMYFKYNIDILKYSKKST
jgi:hypothetical protein